MGCKWGSLWGTRDLKSGNVCAQSHPVPFQTQRSEPGLPGLFLLLTPGSGKATCLQQSAFYKLNLKLGDLNLFP